jgi:hypothetical protein
MTEQQAVEIAMKARGWKPCFHIPKRPTEIEGFIKRDEDFISFGEALAECLNLNVLAEIAKEHKWIWRPDFANERFGIRDSEDRAITGWIYNPIFQSAALIATAEALEAKEGK